MKWYSYLICCVLIIVGALCGLQLYKLHDEQSFKKRLKYTFANFCRRKQWKYMGVWERSPEKQRLHFHGLFNIPDGQMAGELFEKRDYNFSLHNMRTTYQNTYFNERFGRSDFEYIDNKGRLGESLAYLMKYIEKTGEKIVCSKGLPQYFIIKFMIWIAELIFAIYLRRYI